jgi:hypothetical protein
VLQRTLRLTPLQARRSKRIHGHALRHRLATHLDEAAYDMRTMQDLLWHWHVATTIFPLVLNHGGRCGAPFRWDEIEDRKPPYVPASHDRGRSGAPERQLDGPG